MAQTKTQIQALLAEVGISPLKRFGQNFLIDGNLLRRLVADAEIRPDDVVLEVGPGTSCGQTECLVTGCLRGSASGCCDRVASP